MSISGAGYGAAKALEEILGEQMLRAQMAQRQREAAAQLALQTRQVEGVEADRATNRALQTRTRDLAEQQYRDGQAQQATDRNIGLDAANVLNMPGMTDEAKANEFRQSALRNPNASSTPGMLKIIEGLTKKPTRHTVTKNVGGKPMRTLVTEEELEGGIEEYREPKTPPAGPRTPHFVRMPDGSFKDINNVAPPGSRPVDVVGERQAPEKEAANQRAVEAMRLFGDDMLNVIDSLIDEQGNLKPEAAGVIGGIGGARPDWAYVSEASQGALANIDRLQSMLNIDTLRDMKNQSRTGATGFGALSERELNVVESSASKLRRRRQADADYAAELKRLRDTIKAGRGGGARPEADKPVADDAAAAAQALIDKARAARGGRP